MTAGMGLPETDRPTSVNHKDSSTSLSVRARLASVTLGPPGLTSLAGSRATEAFAPVSFLTAHPFAVRPRRFHDLGGFCLHGLPVCCNWRRSWGSTRFGAGSCRFPDQAALRFPGEPAHELPRAPPMLPRIALLPFEAFLPDDSGEHLAQTPLCRAARLSALVRTPEESSRDLAGTRHPTCSPRFSLHWPPFEGLPVERRPLAGMPLAGWVATNRCGSPRTWPSRAWDRGGDRIAPVTHSISCASRHYSIVGAVLPRRTIPLSRDPASRSRCSHGLADARADPRWRIAGLLR